MNLQQSEVEDGDSGPQHPVTPFGWMLRVLLGVIVLWVIGYLLFPPLSSPQWFRARTYTSNNLKQIGLALYNYHDTYGTFPPAVIPDEEGKPMHSWRVLILPFIEEEDLYQQYNFDKPWDDPENLKLVERIPEVYALPYPAEDQPEGLTTYLAISAKGTVLGTTEASRLEDIAQPTVMAIDAEHHPIPWTQPIDIAPEQVHVDPERIIGLSKEGTHLLMSDGSVRFVENKPPRADVRRRFYVDGGSKIDEDR